MDYNYDSSFLERVNNVREVGFKKLVEAWISSTFDQWYPDFFMGRYSHDVDVGTLLTILHILDKWSPEGVFGICNDMERENRNSQNQLLAEICLKLKGEFRVFLAHCSIIPMTS